ncbi:hypothetical protein EHO57_13985 [Leptospira langatensis]|uniref:Uncharacterized protein n=1 Tax=Leptospira langatensis TaxID=2484983 RepID=A0A5R2ASU7_9LEPT|nr:hypothetical protein [Leptospira langatensis]TGJ99865.1 hypothetical protein EHO57_13985 [Leptospira langatensis]
MPEEQAKDVETYFGLIASAILALAPLLRAILKKLKQWNEKRKREQLDNELPITSPYIDSIEEITRLEVRFDRQFTPHSADSLLSALVKTFHIAKMRKVESLKIDFAHYGTINATGQSVIFRFVDYIAEQNGLRVVMRFPADSPDAAKLYSSLQKYRSGKSSGQIEFYLHDYSELLKHH